jgi:tetratricopeptide (TPR) repeat protein
MDAVTYPVAEVSNFINDTFIPVRVRFDAKPLSEEFNVKWTPTLVILDTGGAEHHRSVGFLAADELLQTLLIGLGRTLFDKDRFTEALVHFERLLANYPAGDSAAEAMYLRGVCMYKSTGKPGFLKEAYERLAAERPNSEWTKRAFPYRLL